MQAERRPLMVRAPEPFLSGGIALDVHVEHLPPSSFTRAVAVSMSSTAKNT